MRKRLVKDFEKSLFDTQIEQAFSLQDFLDGVMKKLFLAAFVVYLLFSGSPVNAADSRKQPTGKIDLFLARDLLLIENYRSNPTKANLERLKNYGVPAEMDPVLLVCLHIDPIQGKGNFTRIESRVEEIFPYTWLPPVGAHKTGFVLANVKSSSIRELIADDEVKRVTSAYRKLKPLNDLSAIETGAAVAWRQQPPITGSGIRLLVIDSGFQLEHPDLPEPAATMDYSDYPDSSEDVTDHISGHGTHTAGTAFGQGTLSEGRFRGMAPDADPLYFKIGKDDSPDATVAATVGAIRGAAGWANADVLAMSYGGHDGFNDGSSAEEQAVDWAVSQGVTCLMSAGNSGARAWHHSQTVPAGETTRPIQIIAQMPQAGAPWELILSWYDSPDTSVHRDLSAVILDGRGEQIFYDEPEWVSSPRGTEARIYLPILELPGDSVSYFVEVTNNSGDPQQFHLFLARYWDLRFIQENRTTLVLLPSTADSCISVGAYTHRKLFMDYRGFERDYSGTLNQLSRFSSIGPRIDGIRKPDITAPGEQTISCRNTDIVHLDSPSLASRIVSNDGTFGEPADYLALEGTSMSCPAAAGAATLILQANPEFTPAQLRERIFRSTRRDEFTGNVPNTSWGWGKIDVENALDVMPGIGVRELLPSAISINAIYPNPFNNSFTIQYIAKFPGLVEFFIYDQLGREVWHEREFVTIAGVTQKALGGIAGNLSTGTYVLKIQANGDTDHAELCLVK